MREPFFRREKLFTHKLRLYEALFNHPEGEKFRVFNDISNLEDYNYVPYSLELDQAYLDAQSLAGKLEYIDTRYTK